MANPFSTDSLAPNWAKASVAAVTGEGATTDGRGLFTLTR